MSTTRPAVVRRALVRWLSRGAWTQWLLGLAPVADQPTERGLIMVQIDGLSRRQLERALAAGKMPYLKGLLDAGGYRLHTLYSGLPSTTPAVQGELFYGVAGAVPAFSFRANQSGRIVRMYDSQPAVQVEQSLAGRGRPLLRGGGAYFDVFGGGAAEAHFCSTSLGWGGLLRQTNPLRLAVLLLLNIWSMLRVCVLLVLEFCLALLDFARGLYSGRDFLKELKFVPTRVAICILARELATIGAKLDIARGLPAIHLNFLGYDEQAHRRGPSSRFAHWTLKGIDDAIARIARAAGQSSAPRYSVWVYADHGQEAVDSYRRRHGRSVAAAVAGVYADLRGTARPAPPADGVGEETLRVRQLGGRRMQRLLPVHGDDPAPGEDDITVAAMGPVGLVYLPGAPESHDIEPLAAALISEAEIPMVLANVADGSVAVWTRAGRFRLPDDGAQVFGADHPFLAEVSAEMCALCRHPDAGDLVICGWQTGAKPMSFPIENGAHGGPGPEETRAFALLPNAVVLAPADPHLRPLALRTAALAHLRRLDTAG